VEGLLQKIVQKLLESNPFAVGDSSTNNHSTDHSSRERFGDFIDTLKDCAKGRRFPFTILLRDPLGNSFISAPLGSSLPPEMDKNLKMTDFERTFDEVCLYYFLIFFHLDAYWVFFSLYMNF